ncbi:MAG: rhomboid family intramembrane serine protease [Bacteroidetes bacterium]|nr:rhomboid family intramembrane serine protease [Bacteroidota bacterium]
MLQNKVARIALIISFLLVFTMWFIHVINLGFDLELYHYGILPQTPSGLIGIIAAPFIHSTADWGHLFNNSVPAFILTWLLFYHYRTIATRVFVIIYLLTGMAMWLLARDSYHIGMSGVIYGLTSFLVFSGFFRKNMRVAAVSLFIIFLYGSMVWGIFPTAVNISWEGHALGFFAGLIVAVLYKYKGPQPQKLRYELEEELGIEPESEYWKEEPVIPAEPQPEKEPESGIEIRYEYKPKSTEEKKD